MSVLGFGTTPENANTKNARNVRSKLRRSKLNLSVPDFNLLWLNKKLLQVWTLLFYPSVRVHCVDEEDR